MKLIVHLIPPPTRRNLGTADSGTTGHYLNITTLCVDKQIVLNPLPIHMSNGEIIYSTHTSLLPNRDLPLEARICHIFPGLNKALASIGELYYHVRIAHFYINNVINTNKTTNGVLIQEGRDPKKTLHIRHANHQHTSKMNGRISFSWTFLCKQYQHMKVKTRPSSLISLCMFLSNEEHMGKIN